ncbi:MAG: class I SAM-dependent DNA methyltransferase [Candidatus Hodarchaeales archaeon]
MNKSSLLSGGKHYDLLVDWEKRLSSEIPFLTDCLKEIEPPVKTILEVGCGTGHHAQVLHNDLGYRVSGVDIEESMIEEASKRVPEAEMLVHDFLDPEVLIGRSFDAIISLGNSVGLIAANSDFEMIIAKFSQLLRRQKGVLIFHLLNTEKERNGWSPPHSVITKQGEYIFVRGFTTTEKFIHPEIITLFRPKNEIKWQMTTTGRTNIPRIGHARMTFLLNKHGFGNIGVFGDYQKSPFKPSSSVDMIYVCNM